MPFSRAFKEIVRLCLQKDPTRRPTASHLLNTSRLFISKPLTPDKLKLELLDNVSNVDDVDEGPEGGDIRAELAKMGVSHAGSTQPEASETQPAAALEHHSSVELIDDERGGGMQWNFSTQNRGGAASNVEIAKRAIATGATVSQVLQIAAAEAEEQTEQVPSKSSPSGEADSTSSNHADTNRELLSMIQSMGSEFDYSMHS